MTVRTVVVDGAAPVWAKHLETDLNASLTGLTSDIDRQAAALAALPHSGSFGTTGGGATNTATAAEVLTVTFTATGPTLHATLSCCFETGAGQNGTFTYMLGELRDVTSGDTLVTASVEMPQTVGLPSGASGYYCNPTFGQINAIGLTVGRSYRVRMLTRTNITPTVVSVVTRAASVAGITA